MHAYRTILVAIDFSEHSDEAIARALDVATRYHAKLHFIHVLELPNYPLYDDMALSGMGAMSAPWSVELDDNLKQNAQRKMQSYAQEFALDAECFEVVCGVPKHEILAKAEALEVDLIVMGRHGMSGWQALLGSTTDAVMHQSPCDVLAVSLEH